MDKDNNKQDFLFDYHNYKFLIAGIVVIAIGFLLMSGGANENPEVFNDEVFSFRRIRLAPTVVLVGFGITVYSILKKNK